MDFEDRVLETVKWCEERREPPLLWAMEVTKYVRQNGKELPNLEVGQLLVSKLCFSWNNPTLWKLLEQGVCSRLLSPLHVLALLTAKVLSHRRSQPEAYRLYLELLSRYALSSASMGGDSCEEKIVKTVDDVLQISHRYGVNVTEVGHVAILFLFSVIVSLIDSTLEDWGLQFPSADKSISLHTTTGLLDMDVDMGGNAIDKRNELREHLRRTNAFMAIELVGKLMENRKAMVLLRLIHLNMPEKFKSLLVRLQFLDAHKLTSPNLNSASQLLVRLSSNVQKALAWEYQLNKREMVGLLIDIGSCSLGNFNNFGADRTTSWIMLDMYMESTMDGKQLPASSAIEILTVLTKTLKVLNRATWQETFQALWISALRLVQREREPLEGPVPHLDARLCVLLSITPLTIARVVEEDDNDLEYDAKRRGLISSLQVLGQFSGLLLPPASVVIAANNAALKAASFVSNSKSGGDGLGGVSHSNSSVKTAGTMQHLIVEACIARKLIDTSAYFWPGYVSPFTVSQTDPLPVPGSPWSTFMEGAPLNGPLKIALIATPASSLAEIEKLYQIALSASDEEKTAAAQVLCGSSLSRGWNIQEHAVKYAVKLLSPPVPPGFSGPASHLVAYMSMLRAILLGLSSFDTVHILSLYGVVPEVAALLLPLCEGLGSLVPTSSYKSNIGDETSPYSVFSCAFLFLLRLWKFYKPHHEHYVSGQGGAMESLLTLEYLLLLRNSRVSPRFSVSSVKSPDQPDTSSFQPIYIESFPKLRAWYSQNQACLASTLSGLSSGNPVHQVANKILGMIYWKMMKGGTVTINPPTSSGSSKSGSPINAGDESYQRPMLPAWEILEAIPFVLEAVLAAYTHGGLSSRDVTTGLRDLVDFLPASLATIISYFSAEVTRGIWKHVQMNGSDWPSPAVNLLSIESEVKEILASAGVNVSSRYAGVVLPATLPLPMAALVSLTITFKLDKSLEYIHGVSGPALESCSSSCPWPSMLIVGSLWAQKVRRWHDFIVVSCCRSFFKMDHEAVVQLLRNCFASFLGPQTLSNTSSLGITGLLGSSVFAREKCVSVAPGLLYIRSCRMIHNVHSVNNVILELVVERSRELACGWTCSGPFRLRASHPSLASAAAHVKEVAYIGASMLCSAGGMRLVHLLYQETMPTWLLSARAKSGSTASGPISCILEGYSMAYLLVLSGSLVWGLERTTGITSVFSRRARVLGAHMDFIAAAIEGNIMLGCDPVTWKAYVSCFVGLVVTFAPAWIPEVKPETLKNVANGLRGWHECELALSLLERGGESAIGSVAELFM
ncbi:mediator of RNA polymerase II transcription subunit 33A-like [Aristolochia californica]|uniref:mediator of RNA polymerase II transcription subunit 33A-like n=1 Tax=Aristolochia californica TaxID=171875 RepID=UPI0035D71935